MVEFLRDMDYSDAEIESELGVTLTDPLAAPLPDRVRVADVRMCKRCGTKPASTKYQRGSLAGLCDDDIEVARQEMSDAARARIGREPRPLAKTPAKTPVEKKHAIPLVTVVEEYRDDETEFEEMLAEEMPMASRPACVRLVSKSAVGGHVDVSRAGLARRVAKKMATSATGQEWWELPTTARRGYVLLAAQFVTALEDVASAPVLEGLAREEW